MPKIKEYKYIILILLAVLASAFYWYEWRPSKIKQRCSADAHMDTRSVSESNDKIRQDLINTYYKDCIMGFGLK
jgi:hypothetical protein